jgi:phytoene desaturase
MPLSINKIGFFVFQRPIRANKTKQHMKVGIIGAGIAGIAAAIRLAAKGHEVTVFEANAYPGGKLSAFDQEGYRFDAGPSLFTMPQYVDELFAVAGENAEAHFQYEKIEAACRYFWRDGTRLTAWADRQRFGEEVEQVLQVPAQRISGFLEESQKKYDLAGRIFLEKSLHRASTWLNFKTLGSMLRIPFYDIFSSMHQVHEQHFRHPKLVQLFDRFATYNGSDPYRAPGMLTIIPHFEHNVGVFYPKGGMHSITTSLYELSLRKGVRYHFSSPVSRILTQEGKAVGIETHGEAYHFDRVVSNMDVFYTYKKLLPDAPHPERILNQPKSTSALIFYWGIRHAFSELDLHNIFFSNDYKAEFEAHTQGRVIDDPTIYVNITSKYTPSDAPPGCENWFVMINAPSDSGQDWPTMIRDIRTNTLRKLSAILGRDLESLIACESILEPRDIERRTSSHLGALYGYSSNNLMAAFLRHPNYSGSVKNLYCCGGSVHPGGGIPLCLLSAKIVADMM